MKSLFNLVIIISGLSCCVRAGGGLSHRGVKDLDNEFASSSRNGLSDVAGESSTPLDLFFSKQPQRRSQIETIWKWDFWCQLQPIVGNCTNFVLRYYYDAQLDKCFRFGYSGCGGNQNNFQTLVECERHCKGTTYMALKETKRTTFCNLQPSPGMCLSLMDRFYYDSNTHECKRFVYGGCGGNQNRFTSKEQCFSRCSGNDE